MKFQVGQFVKVNRGTGDIRGMAQILQISRGGHTIKFANGESARYFEVHLHQDIECHRAYHAWRIARAEKIGKK